MENAAGVGATSGGCSEPMFTSIQAEAFGATLSAEPSAPSSSDGSLSLHRQSAARNQAWLGETMRALEPLASGRYIGEVDLTARPERARTSFSPAAWQRLNAVRDHYDGEHLVGWFPGLG